MRFSRFMAAGLVNTGLTYFAYLLLLLLVPYGVAYTLSYLLGIVLGYLLNAYWVFGHRPAASTAVRYPVAYLANYGLGLSLLWLFVEHLHVPKQVAPFAVLLVTTPTMYLMTRFVFSPENKA